MLTVASFNVNSLRARMPNVLAWLKSPAAPDVALLQEIKCLDEEVPRMEIEALGYRVSAVGMKARHGVALLSKMPHRVEVRDLPGDGADEVLDKVDLGAIQQVERRIVDHHLDAVALEQVVVHLRIAVEGEAVLESGAAATGYAEP